MFDAAPAGPLDELEELKRILRPVEIAEAIGRRPETISRLRPGRPLSRRTEQRLDDLYALARRLSREVREPEAVRFQLLRRREELGGRRLVDLIRAGEADAAMEPSRADVEDFEVDPKLVAELLEAERAARETNPVVLTPERVDLEGHLAAHPELRDPLGRVEEVARAIVGPDVELVPQLLFDDEAEPELFVGLRTGLPTSDSVERLGALYEEIGELLRPLAGRMTVGLA